MHGEEAARRSGYRVGSVSSRGRSCVRDTKEGGEQGPRIVRVRVRVTTAGSEGEPEPSSLSRALSRNVVSGESQYCNCRQHGLKRPSPLDRVIDDDVWC